MTTIDVDALANELRRLGGTSVLGCDALAEALMPFLAGPSTGAVAWVTVPVEPTEAMADAAHVVWRDHERKRLAGGGGELPFLHWETAYYKAMIAAAPPSSPSERDAALEDAAKVAEGFPSFLRRHLQGSQQAADASRSIAEAIRALKASRSDTVGPEAGE